MMTDITQFLSSVIACRYFDFALSYLIGVISLLYMVKKVNRVVTIDGFCMCMVFGILGPIWLFIFLVMWFNDYMNQHGYWNKKVF